ncbi:tetratricopeptide repeat protein [Roseospira marina]|uniref:Tetratricopeptide repeat protein n=1 Tax=Roseospira marina TaxID=140057 RepID=A0A5M6I9R2_9PROT|nr:tetratricopeptide repeat protein [Roseospira marina]KAA5604697.1 tetratricopeptide repeat protein [Roseospira marina]MBB4315145.1 tetratricopeptide (TPR) repeat protein [Roseospira marina]MBB5088085.1 tetratricopeptide (TPR) repeat protein [Roseospira marina]
MTDSERPEAMDRTSPRPSPPPRPPDETPLARALRLFRAGEDTAVQALAVTIGADHIAPDADTLHLMRLIGLAALRSGNGDEALRWLSHAQEATPTPDIALRVALGGACLATGALEEAEVRFRAVLADAPSAVGAAIGLARALEEQGDRAGALAGWRRAMAALIARTSPDADVWMLALPPHLTGQPLRDLMQAAHKAGDAPMMAHLRHRLQALHPGDDDSAVEGRDVPFGGGPAPFDEIMADLVPTLTPPDAALGTDMGSAVALLEARARHRPEDPAVLHQRALALWDAGDGVAALALIEAAQDTPALRHHAPLLRLWASLLRAAGRLDAAVEITEQAITADPGSAEAWRTLAQIHEQAGRLDDALMASHGAVLRAPGFVWGHGLVGRLLERRNQVDPAIERYRRAVAAEPENIDAHLSLALALLRRGDWAEGWDAYEWRRPRTDRPADTFEAPPWTGGTTASHPLLIWNERQGVAEALMFLRLAPAAGRQSGGRLVLEVDRRIVPLVARGLPEATVVATADPPAPDTRAPDLGAQVPFGSLARLVGPDPAASITPAPTIAADPERAAALRSRYIATATATADDDTKSTAPDLLVGLSWTPLDATRYPDRVVPWDALAPLFAVPGVRFVSIQPSAGGPDPLEDNAPALPGPLLRDATIEADPDDLDGRAAQIAALDAVVTIDGLAAHLTGALAVPGLVLLPYAADWRWGLSGTRSVWYPALRLARQTTPGDWTGPVARAATALGHYRDAARAAREPA